MLLLGETGGLVCAGKGTLGILVRQGPDLLLLSCSHVIARSGNFGIPFLDVPETWRVVQQPWSCDAAVNQVGRLTSEFTTIQSSDSGLDNQDDCALALIDRDRVGEPSPIQTRLGLQIPSLAREHPSEWARNTKVRLLGAISGCQNGVIRRFLGDETVRLSWCDSIAFADFKGLVEYGVSCRPGDSGGAVIDEQDRLLGMHIGGSTSGSTGYFLPLGAYFNSKGLELV